MLKAKKSNEVIINNNNNNNNNLNNNFIGTHNNTCDLITYEYEINDVRISARNILTKVKFKIFK